MPNVSYHHEDGMWWAESSDMPGWSGSAKTFAEIAHLTDEARQLWADGFFGQKKD